MSSQTLTKVGFIHIPKTGGLSVKKSFDNTEISLISELHKPYCDLSEKQKIAFPYFSVVRNPFDRIFSFYHFFLGSEVNRKFLLRIDKNTHISFDEFVNGIKFFHPFIKPCWDFITVNEKIKVDEILYFETLKEDFSKFTEKYGLITSLDWFHQNPNKPKTEKYKIYKSYQIELIQNVFKKDFDNFGYSFESWIEES